MVHDQMTSERIVKEVMIVVEVKMVKELKSAKEVKIVLKSDLKR